MSYKPKISIIIPTYNRSNYLIKIIKKLILSKIPNEIIICDSRSIDQTKNKIRKLKSDYKNHIIKYIDIFENSNAKKRNIGIKNSSSKYIIFLDDDCIPEIKFLENYYKILEKFKNKNNVFCGTVKYPQKKLYNNLIRFRQSRHFIISKKNLVGNYSLHSRNIVTMNMGLKKDLLVKNKIFFSEKFKRYGFEDYEFGFRLNERKINIIPCCPVVYHYDFRNFEKFLDKFKFVGYEGSKHLKKINLKSSLENNYIKMENNFFIKQILKFKILYKILIFIEKKFLVFEKKVKLPFYLYKLLTVNSYLIGYLLYKNNMNNKNINFKWYR